MDMEHGSLGLCFFPFSFFACENGLLGFFLALLLSVITLGSSPITPNLLLYYAPLALCISYLLTTYSMVARALSPLLRPVFLPFFLSL